jgi:hypothetical protein
MKGDFSRWAFDPVANFSGVLYQQGRVRTDVDDNAATQIDRHWRELAARDVIGSGVAAVSGDASDGFKVVAASVVAGQVSVRLLPGRLWADGLHLYLSGAGPVDLSATYLAPPLQNPQANASSIAAGVRDAVVLEVWEESVSAFQEPLDLLEPALGGPDTTERSKVCAAVKLMRLGPNDDCSAVAAARDDFAAKGKLTVTPAPAIAISGDCPVEAGGGYTGFEHYLFRIEVAEPLAGEARFKWSQFNGGMVGRGRFAAGGPGTGTVTVTANDQMINHCGMTSFYLEALARDPVFGCWRVMASADAILPQNGKLALTNIQGAWPAAGTESAFFRLWNGIRPITDFPPGPNPLELQDGIRLAFQPPVPGNSNYVPGDYWTFPVRASGTPFDPALLPTNAPPRGVHYRRVALATLTWNAGLTAAEDQGEIDDCRHVFLPLTKQKGCCTFVVGDGVRTHGDFDSIEAALRQLPASGGEICLLPGLHQTNAVIRGKRNVRIHGCHSKTKIVPRKGAATDPIFRITDSVEVALERMDMVTLGGTAILVEGTKPSDAADIEIADNRILACHNAVVAINAARVAIHHNRIRMLDKRDSGVAIYLAGDDSLIERNDIRLVPAPKMPPLEVPDDPRPIDPNDPCARLEVVYVNPRIFTFYVEKVWLVPLLPLPILLQPYRALSGIQLGGGSERVRVIENVVVGGAGNGITLGDSVAAPTPTANPIVELPVDAGRIRGQVFGPDGKPVPGAQVTLTRQQDGKTMTFGADENGKFSVSLAGGKYTVDATASGLEIDKAELRPIDIPLFALAISMKPTEKQPDITGFLYQIEIAGNNISAMGLSGVGLPSLRLGTTPTGLSVGAAAGLTRARLLLGNPVIGLEIRNNHITGCLQNPFDNALRAETRLRGIGGISLGLCDDVAILDNRIEANGTTAANPTCGIFVQYGEGVDIRRNHILDNGPLPAQGAPELAPGHRGGIVLNLVGSLNLLAGAADKTRAASSKPRPAARVHENVVDQPAGRALHMSGVGALICTDNSFTSELSGPSELEQQAGTVFIYNIGGTQNAAPGIRTSAGVGLASAATVAVQPGIALTRAAAAMVLLPDGNTLFNDNQSRTGAGNESANCQVISCLDDLAYQGNQSHSARAGNLLSNVHLNANTLRAIGNRFAEVGAQTQMSLFTLAVRMNDTSLNQGDHCIIATDQNPAMAEVRTGNQVLNPSPLCADRLVIATTLFKPQG